MTRNEIIEVAKGFYTDYFSEREIAFARLILKQAEKLRQWQGLTDEDLDIRALWDVLAGMKNADGSIVVQFARAIEAKLKEKNT